MKQLVTGGIAGRWSKTKLLEYLRKKYALKNLDLDPEEQLTTGAKVEREHTTSLKIATRIAMDHLREIPDYYVRLDKMERAAEKYWS